MPDQRDKYVEDWAGRKQIDAGFPPPTRGERLLRGNAWADGLVGEPGQRMADKAYGRNMPVAENVGINTNKQRTRDWAGSPVGKQNKIRKNNYMKYLGAQNPREGFMGTNYRGDTQMSPFQRGVLEELSAKDGKAHFAPDELADPSRTWTRNQLVAESMRNRHPDAMNRAAGRNSLGDLDFSMRGAVEPGTYADEAAFKREFGHMKQADVDMMYDRAGVGPRDIAGPDIEPSQKVNVNRGINRRMMGKLPIVGALPMPSTVMNTYKDMQSPLLSNQDKMLRFLLRGANEVATPEEEWAAKGGI